MGGLVDLNLLHALDALLAEGSVAGAARRLGLSPSAMSRTLARLRSVTGDPLLVRAGGGLVPTPHAVALRGRVHGLARDVRAVLAPRSGGLSPACLDGTFTIRAGEGFLALFCVPVVAAVTAAAPRVCLRFVHKPDKDADPLRDGRVDLEIGASRSSGPELRTRLLFRDSFVGAVRSGHPLLEGALTPARYAACGHVVASRRGTSAGPVDEALAALGLARRVVAVVPGFPDALRLAHGTDLVALVPRGCLGPGRAGVAPPNGLVGFALPVRTPAISVSVMWHPRLDADPAQTWLRATVIAACRATVAPG